MREIKFRGRDDLTGNGWVYGDFSYGYYGNQCLVDEIAVVEKTVGQFTVLKDANGREIYEGDIVKCGSGRICKVVFFTSACACCFDLVPVGGFDCKPPKESTLWTDLTVIGNVYDNPDLLEAYV